MEKREEEGVCEQWSIKDILSHLDAWHRMVISWYKEGGRDKKKLELPTPGYTWKDTPALNEKIYLEHKNDKYDSVVSSLKESFKEVRKIIESNSDKDLFTKQVFRWTGTTSLGSYLVSATSSHYKWAYDLIRKWWKNSS